MEKQLTQDAYRMQKLAGLIIEEQRLQELAGMVNEDEKILVTRRSSEERKKNFSVITNKKIQQYMKNGNKGDLNLRNVPITSLPPELKMVGGYLDLKFTKITSLPSGLKVGGSLNLNYTSILSLPAGLKVGGSLLLLGTKITSLPEGLKVGGNLYLGNNKITSLPADLEVEGFLDLSGTPFYKKYTREQIKQMYPGVKGQIIK